MKISIISRIYNEAPIIAYFIEYYKELANGGFYFYDDGSTDESKEIIKNYLNTFILEGNRESTIKSHNSQKEQRMALIELVKNKADYILLLDIDEFIDPSIDLFSVTADAVNFKLFDLYITEKDKNLYWVERSFIGPEYRDIVMMVKLSSYKTIKNDRTLIYSGQTIEGGYVKHIGKGISIDYWEKKCQHYTSKGMPKKYSAKWEKRKGKAIHTLSDFNRELIPWDKKEQYINNWVKIE